MGRGPRLGTADESAAVQPGGRKFFAASSPTDGFDGGLHLGEPSLRFEAETKIQSTPLRDGNDTGFNDLNPRSSLRIPFIESLHRFADQVNAFLPPSGSHPLHS